MRSRITKPGGHSSARHTEPRHLRAAASPLLFKRHQSTAHGLPFKVSREQANSIFAKSHKFLDADRHPAETSSVVAYKADPVVACYMPFHSADIKNLYSVYVGERGHYRTEFYYVTVLDKDNHPRQELRTRTVTDWFRCSGSMDYTNYPFGVKDTQIFAGFGYPSVLVENSLRCYDVVGIVPITDEMLNFGGKKKIVYPHEMNMGYALEKLNGRVYDLERHRAINDIKTKHKADEARIHTLDIYLSEADIQLFSYFMPAYICQTSVTGLNSYKIVNGFDGNISGNRIYSVFKSTIAGAGVSGFAALALTAFSPHTMLVSQILFRLALASSFGGAISGFFANWSNVSKNYEFISGMKKEFNENSQFPQSDEDIERREYAEQVNGYTDFVHNHGHNIRLPADKCKLLGLDPEQDITLEMVKKAYHSKIKKWHPDLFRENNSKRQAEEMTRQLNAANEELTKILRNNPQKI